MRRTLKERPEKARPEGQHQIPLSFQRLNDANLTLIGKFNPAIIQPQWVVRTGVSEDQTYYLLVPVGDGPRVYAADEWGWTVSSDRLVVFGPVRTTSGFVGRLLDQLPHTPISAVGANFRCHHPPSPIPPSLAPSLAALMPDKALVEAVESRSIDLGNGVVLRITHHASAKERWHDYNFHLDSSDVADIVAHCNRGQEFEVVVRELEETRTC